MTMIEALASLGLAAAVAVAVAQATVVSARSRATVQGHATALLAAGNALERLRATDEDSLSEMAASLTGPIPGAPGSRLEIELGDRSLGDVPAREIIVHLFERPGAIPTTLVGWQIVSGNEGGEP